MRLSLPEQLECLPAGDAAGERRCVPWRQCALPGYLSSADVVWNPSQDLRFGAHDGDDQLSSFVGVSPGQRYGSFAVDQSSDVSCIDRRQDLLFGLAHRVPAVKKKPPADNGRGLVMVEAAGQPVCLFRGRLDYAFTPISRPGAGRVIRGVVSSNPSAGSAAASSAGL